MLATRLGVDTIAVTRTFDGVEEAAHRVIEQVGGMASVLKGSKVAVLKPNFVAGRGAETGSTTSFALLKAVAEEVQACGAEPVLCEMPGTEFDREATYTILGVEKFCAEQGIRILRIDPEGGEQDWVEVRAAGAKKLRRFHIPRILNEACLINLPVLKTHVVSIMTLGMKNPMGILPRPDRRAMHTFGIDQCIVDMNLAIKPDLTIVDGSVGQDGEGPLYGDKADLQVLVAGRDSLAVDLACCQLVGVKPRDVPHLKLALEQIGAMKCSLFPSPGYPQGAPLPWTNRPAGSSVHGRGAPCGYPGSGGAPLKLTPMSDTPCGCQGGVGEELEVIKRFRLPKVKPLYRFIFWMMYPLDYPYSWLAERGKHFCTTLYSTGLVGTRPQIKEENCTRCGVCVESCPLPNVIDLTSLRVNYATCQRCLLCYEACPEEAISVKGYSGTRR
jgi:uncharacterized protein (DUF362 family)/Pyruvate/2-oxoacid:ferredoxin oxidoreductase delta subunit